MFEAPLAKSPFPFPSYLLFLKNLALVLKGLQVSPFHPTTDPFQPALTTPSQAFTRLLSVTIGYLY